MIQTVAIVGGGYSGAMLAVRLAEAGLGVRLINRTADFGLGVAYSTPCDRHLLNVRSGRMSARPDDPRHFVRWLERNHPALAEPDGFAPRRLYGLYIQEGLDAALKAHPGAIDTIVGEAVGIEGGDVRLADGSLIAADTVVLATGNPPPRGGTDGEAVIRDPWAKGALDRIGPHEDAVIVGSGLTMIDMLLMLDARGWTGRATVISRRGLVPRAHDAAQISVPPRHPAPGPLSRRLNAARREARADGWAVMMDRLRDINAELWGGLTLAERARFLRHLRPWWDVHRHRVAAEPAARMRALAEAGRLTVVAGRLKAIEPGADGVVVRWRPRGSGADQAIRAGHVIDCTGPGHDPARAEDALTRQLLQSGRARPAPLGLGLDVDDQGRVIGADGQPSGLYMLGPPALSAFWETVAVPDIRLRIEQVAGQLTA